MPSRPIQDTIPLASTTYRDAMQEFIRIIAGNYKEKPSPKNAFIDYAKIGRRLEKILLESVKVNA